MRVENGAVNGTTASPYTEKLTKGGSGSRTASTASSTGSDTSSLSNASDLVQMAKHLTSPDRLTHVAAINAAVNNGSYQSDVSSVSQALVEEHLNS